MSLRALTNSTTGMLAQSVKLNVLANNLANSTTDGFKRARAEFADLLYSVAAVPGGAGGEAGAAPGVGLAIGSGTAMAATTRDFRQGPLRSTSRPLDVALQGTGFFVVEDFQGVAAYTRNGNLRLDAEGALTIFGRRVEPRIEIPAEATSVTISPEGRVFAAVGAAQPIELSRLQAARFTNPEGLLALEEGLFQESPASGPPDVGAFHENGFGAIVQGSLEGSNVEPVEELVDLLTSQHAFALSAQALKAADERLRLLGQLRT